MAGKGSMLEELELLRGIAGAARRYLSAERTFSLEVDHTAPEVMLERGNLMLGLDLHARTFPPAPATLAPVACGHYFMDGICLDCGARKE